MSAVLTGNHSPGATERRPDNHRHGPLGCTMGALRASRSAGCRAASSVLGICPGPYACGLPSRAAGCSQAPAAGPTSGRSGSPARAPSFYLCRNRCSGKPASTSQLCLTAAPASHCIPDITSLIRCRERYGQLCVLDWAVAPEHTLASWNPRSCGASPTLQWVRLARLARQSTGTLITFTKRVTASTQATKMLQRAQCSQPAIVLLSLLQTILLLYISVVMYIVP